LNEYESLRYNQLWEKTKPFAKSKATFDKNLTILTKEGFIKREEKNPRNVSYRIHKDAIRKHKEDFSFVMRVSSWGSISLIADCMEYIHDQDELFGDKIESTKAAIEFWIIRYRNLCTLNSLFALHLSSPYEVTVLDLRKLYQKTEDKYFEILHEFQKNDSDRFQQALIRILSFQQIDLTPSWGSMKLEEFMKKYYPDVFKKLSGKQRADIYFTLLKQERERESIYCDKRKKKLPRWACGLCQHYKPSRRRKRIHKIRCKFQRVKSVREESLDKQKKLVEKMKNALLNSKKESQSTSI